MSFIKISVPNSPATGAVHVDNEVYLHTRDGSVIEVAPGEHTIVVSDRDVGGIRHGLKAITGGVFGFISEVKKNMNGETGRSEFDIDIPEDSLVTITVKADKCNYLKVLDYEITEINDADVSVLKEAAKKTT